MEIGYEIWKTIIGNEHYMVSSFGRIKSLERVVFKDIKKQTKKRIREYITFGRKLSNGYMGFVLSNDCLQHQKLVHRIVAEHFIPNPENKPEVNHINGIKDDNRAENLEWATSSENQIHAIRTGLQSGFNSKIVLNIATGVFYDTMTEAANSINMRVATLSRKLNGLRKNNTNFVLV